jgi:hypothetical protein
MEEFYFLGYKGFYFVESQPPFCKNMMSCCLLHVGSLLGYRVNPEDGGDMFPPKVGCSSSRLHGVISQKTELLITTAVGSSDSSCLETGHTTACFQFLSCSQFVFIFTIH